MGQPQPVLGRCRSGTAAFNLYKCPLGLQTTTIFSHAATRSL